VAKKILVVDDDENQRRLYAQEFRDEGYEVVLAASGRAAIESVASDRPDIVVLDICMPDMDGLEALGAMIGGDYHIPIVLNTAYASYRDNFMSWAADAYIIKSADLTRLKDTVRGLLESGRSEGGRLPPAQPGPDDAPVH
jgi:DNA-binding NtrC family response regulator